MLNNHIGLGLQSFMNLVNGIFIIIVIGDIADVLK